MEVPSWVRALVIGAILGGVVLYAYQRWEEAQRMARFIKALRMGVIP